MASLTSQPKLIGKLHTSRGGISMKEIESKTSKHTCKKPGCTSWANPFNHLCWYHFTFGDDE